MAENKNKALVCTEEYNSSSKNKQYLQNLSPYKKSTTGVWCTRCATGLLQRIRQDYICQGRRFEASALAEIEGDTESVEWIFNLWSKGLDVYMSGWMIKSLFESLVG